LPPQHSTVRPAYTSNLFGTLVLFIAVLCVAFVRVLYILTYPLNNDGGDTSNYYYMLINGTTNLIHASGYPFLVGEIARFIVGPGEVSSPAYSFAVLAIQHSIEVVTLGAAAFVVRKIFGIVTALIFLLLAGCSVFAMSWTTAVYPEWLQGCLLLITLCLVVAAISCNSLLPKFLLYVLASLAFAWAFLAKYNSGVFLPLFLISLVAEYRAIGGKAAWFVLAPLPALASVFAFVVNVHLPSSGTKALHLDAGWVLTTGLPDALLNDPGPYALQWLALSATVPPAYNRARAWRRINDPPQPGEEAAVEKYKAEYLRLSRLSPAELKAFLSEHPLPKEFILGNSAIPIYEFIGLEAGDKLGTKVFIEYVTHHPIFVIQRAIRKSLTYALTDLAYSLVPGGSDGLVVAPGVKLASGFVLYSSTMIASTTRYHSSPAMLFWEPGNALFNAMLEWWPGRLIEFGCCALSLIWALAVTIHRRRLTLGPGIVFTLAIALPALVVVSNIILEFRDKEVRALWPLACLFWAVGIGSIVQRILPRLNGAVGPILITMKNSFETPDSGVPVAKGTYGSSKS
jgi:hypothetical protein